MPANIVFTQNGHSSSPGAALEVEPGLPVVCSNTTAASIYVWTLADVPIRSSLVRGTKVSAATFAFTPDVKGTYLVSLQVNNSKNAEDNASGFCAILSEQMGWRYRAAGEANEDIGRINDFNGNSLGFPNDINERGWATEDDLEREQVEDTVYQVRSAVEVGGGTTGPTLVRTSALSGVLHTSLIPKFELSVGTATDEWTLEHNLNKHPHIVLTDGEGNVFEGRVQHVSKMLAKVYLSEPRSGSATCS